MSGALRAHLANELGTPPAGGAGHVSTLSAPLRHRCRATAATVRRTGAQPGPNRMPAITWPKRRVESGRGGASAGRSTKYRGRRTQMTRPNKPGPGRPNPASRLCLPAYPARRPPDTDTHAVREAFQPLRPGPPLPCPVSWSGLRALRRLVGRGPGPGGRRPVGSRTGSWVWCRAPAKAAVRAPGVPGGAAVPPSRRLAVSGPLSNACTRWRPVPCAPRGPRASVVNPPDGAAKAAAADRAAGGSRPAGCRAGSGRAGDPSRAEPRPMWVIIIITRLARPKACLPTCRAAGPNCLRVVISGVIVAP